MRLAREKALRKRRRSLVWDMSSTELSHYALELPAEERLELARRLVESVVVPEPLSDGVLEGVKRLEDMVMGRVKGLTEEEYRQALK